MRVPAFVWSSRVPLARRGGRLASAFHVSDWFPTLVRGAPSKGAAAGGAPAFDGVDQWAAIMATADNATSGRADDGAVVTRTSLLVHLDIWGKSSAGGGIPAPQASAPLALSATSTDGPLLLFRRLAGAKKGPD